LDRSARIFVAGHRGLVGSAIVRALEASGFGNLLLRSRAELDLLDLAAVRRFFSQEKPEYVFIAAARVGGIAANNTFPAEFIHENTLIAAHLIDESWRNKARRVLYLGSSCIYPRDCPQPISEGYLMTGPLEPTNSAYALAKIAGIEMCAAYNRQYGTRFLSVMPTNLYGPNDNYDLNNAHVLPALIRKFHEAKLRGDATVVAWGTGAPRREFMYVDDMADACVYLMQLGDADFDRLIRGRAPLVNIGVGEDLTIRELTEMVARIVGYEGQVVWDTTKPDGTPRKLLDVSRLAALGWSARTSLPAGMARTYAAYCEQLPKVATTGERATVGA
jgi:GDP-L-fucose synthase